jgi:hypothetical protein
VSSGREDDLAQMRVSIDLQKYQQERRVEGKIEARTS